ncbi:MAG: YicC family protein [Syntrophomonadaceae bacterium]|nr:YicC family protein [Syntrophomonadaceae bacterium]
MANSMTGYGQAQVNRSGYQISCEVRSVNHRYLDTNIRMPRRYALLEDNIKEEIKKYVSRGRLEFTINIEKTEAKARNIKVDKDLAITYHRYLKELADDVNISPQIKIIDLFRLPEVFVLEEDVEDVEEIWPILQIALTEAMQSLVAMRNREGNYLIEDILQRTDLIADMVTELEQRSPLVAKEHTDKLRQRISGLIGNELLDEARIYQEAALFAERINATEEIVRLQSHIQHLRQLLQEQNSVGRKCDFLVQEMFREINTIASKANDYEMSRIVVETKAELEKIREQLQNLE